MISNMSKQIRGITNKTREAPNMRKNNTDNLRVYNLTSFLLRNMRLTKSLYLCTLTRRPSRNTSLSSKELSSHLYITLTTTTVTRALREITLLTLRISHLIRILPSFINTGTISSASLIGESRSMMKAGTLLHLSLLLSMLQIESSIYSEKARQTLWMASVALEET